MQFTSDKTFVLEFFEAVKKTPWIPSPRQVCQECLHDHDSDEFLDEVPEDSNVVEAEMNEDVGEAVKVIKGSKRIIEEKTPAAHRVYIIQPDFVRFWMIIQMEWMSVCAGEHTVSRSSHN